MPIVNSLSLEISIAKPNILSPMGLKMRWVSFGVLVIFGQEKENQFEITAVYSVSTIPSIGAMPDDLETISVNIANQYVKFIEFFEAFKEKDK